MATNSNSSSVTSASGVSQGGVGNKKFSKGKFVKNQQGREKSCSFYGKTSHVVETCFRKHVFPLHFKKGQGSVINNTSSEDCDEEDELSHEESQPSPNFNLIKEQYQGLLALL